MLNGIFTKSPLFFGGYLSVGQFALTFKNILKKQEHSGDLNTGHVHFWNYYYALCPDVTMMFAFKFNNDIVCVQSCMWDINKSLFKLNCTETESNGPESDV